jgi:hypothetical protein
MDINIVPGEKTGQTLLRLGLIKERHVNNILIRQTHGDSRKFGQIAVALHYLRANIMSKYLRESNRVTHTLNTAPAAKAKTGNTLPGISGSVKMTAKSFK